MSVLGALRFQASSDSAALRTWIASRLDPLDTAPQYDQAFCSDYDLAAIPRPDDQAFIPAAVLIALARRGDSLSLILTRRADTLRKHTGQIALPGGRSDPGEHPVQTALREAQEEIGLDPAKVILAGLSTAYRTGTGYHITPVVGFLAADFNTTANPAEVAEIFEAPFGFLMDPANHEQREAPGDGGNLRRFYAMTWDDRIIWGATAGILRALYDRLYGGALA